MTERELKIDTMIYGGAGLAHASNEAIMVPFTLPGELVSASIDEARRSAELLRVITPSPHRVEPACVHFGICGGCQYQHAGYQAQLEIKRDILLSTLARAGVHTTLQPQVHSAKPYHYRNRIQLRAERIDGQMRLGYSQRGTHAFLPITMCPIAAQPLWQTAEAIMALWNTTAIATQPLREVELFLNHDESSMQASFYLDIAHASMDRDAAEHFRALCASLQQQLPALKGAGLFVWSAPATPKQKHRSTLEVVRWSEPSLQYTVNNLHYTVPRAGFFQVNRYLIPELVQTVLANHRGQLAWDLYAGAGLFTQPLATRFQSVIAVESGDRSFESLQSLVTRLGRNHKAVRAETLAFLKTKLRTSEKPDLVIADPPRAGLGLPVCDAIATIQPQTLVYVSCDPTTLSRDLKRLLESGYRLAELHLADLFPQTFHMETVAVLSLPVE